MSDDEEDKDKKEEKPDEAVSRLDKMMAQVDEIITDLIQALGPHCGPDATLYDVMLSLSAAASVVQTLEMRMDKMGIDWETIGRIKRTGENRALNYLLYSEGKMLVPGEDDV